ncbi:hypothetical protein [Bifidobacterium sp. ESL0704]|nr:hypothetical protein [Bifidobacterium sp. ESL0704]WEV52797.1 hypothetical protein OZX64_08040 [Bifidobacterium sp. ESL0704]
MTAVIVARESSEQPYFVRHRRLQSIDSASMVDADVKAMIEGSTDYRA